MIKTILESKYIRLTILGTIVLVMALCLFGLWKGEEIEFADDSEEILLEHGDFLVIERDGVQTVETKDGEIVYTTRGEDAIIANYAGFWVVEAEVSDGGAVSTLVWYLLDDNFEVAAEGKLFDAIDGTEDYVYGKVLVNEDYYNMEPVAEYGLFGPFPESENCVLDKSGKIVYTSDHCIFDMQGDKIVLQDEQGKYIFLDIKTGEKEAAGNDYRG